MLLEILFRYLYKLAIYVKQGKKHNENFAKVFYVIFLFTFFKNFVCNIRAKFVNKENVTVIEITSTWSSNIGWSYKLVKGCRRRNIQFNWEFGDAANYPSQRVQDEALVETQRVKPLKTLTISSIKLPGLFNADCVYIFK